MEEEFEALPRSLKRKIDEAFDRAVREARGSAPRTTDRKEEPGEPKYNQDSQRAADSASKEDDLGGGFLPPEDDDMGGGGFIPMDTDEDGGGFMPAAEKEPATHIPLSLIPRAVSGL